MENDIANKGCIFLDLDGVLIHVSTDTEKQYDLFDDLQNWIPEAVENLNKLIGETEMKIVISSDQRKKRHKEDFLIKFKQLGINIDKQDTILLPCIDHEEIGRFFYINKFISEFNIDKYIIIDDNTHDSEMFPELQDRFILCDHMEGFNDEALQRALKIIKIEEESENLMEVRKIVRKILYSNNILG